MKVQVFRQGIEIIKLPLERSVFSRKLMGDHTLAFSLQEPSKLDLMIGDHLVYQNEVLTINKNPDAKKLSSNLFQNDFIFQGPRHSLVRWIIQDEGAIIFPYDGDLESHMFMFLESLNSKDPEGGWTVGELEEVPVFHLDFRATNFWDALNMIAEAAGCEWQIRQKVISIKKTVGQETSIKLSYGKNNGLYSIERKTIDNSMLVNRAYGIGGSQNLPKDYPYEILMLPNVIEDQESIDANGPFEKTYENVEIYPQRPSTVSDIDQYNEGTFIVKDSTLDFDLNGHFIAGTEPKIIFKNGALMNQEFKILSYNHERKEIRYEANKDSNGKLTPFGYYRAEVGDSYTIVGIRLPQAYIDTALLELQEKVQEFVDSNKVPRVIYALDIDVLDAKRKTVYPNEGDFIEVSDTSLGIVDEVLRVTYISFPGTFPEILTPGMKFTCEVGGDVTYSRVQKIERDIKETKEVVKQATRTSWENDRRNIIALNEFKGKVIDPDGNLEKPLIEGIVGFFGAQSMIYDLENVTYIVNEGNDPNSFSISGGQLIHKVFKIDPDQYIWELTGLSINELDPLKPYYLTARCSQTQPLGSWVLSETEMTTESEPGYWHFNLGILSSVIEGVRSLQSTKGYTVISGGQIITDSITAYYINVKKLFAQYIEALNMVVTGNSKIGPFSIDADGLYYYVAGTEQIRFRINRDGIQWVSSRLLPGPTPKDSSIKLGLTSALLDIQNDGNTSKTTGVRINMPSSGSYQAIEVLSGISTFNGQVRMLQDLRMDGDVFVGTRQGESGIFHYSYGATNYFLEYVNGLLVRQGLSSEL
ncbi:phage tail protein [Sphingobacterium cellulitidis]|uniref:phage tail protein n=1 Tax=Sphingobacterium cellulitidis TaxID=1768011 RepID=UPI000B93D395|nr:hypothetical protein CHT99_15530 [Sphingobacterium cellulitidis]